MFFYPIVNITNGNELCKPVFTLKIRANQHGIPQGDYYVLENYCYEKKCDCRKVMINIADRKTIYATISYGWEPLKFYKKWLYGDEEVAKEMKGPSLEFGGIQSPYAQYFLDFFRELIKNPRAAESFKNHYTLFRNHIHHLKKDSPCICGSEKQAEKCCYPE